MSLTDDAQTWIQYGGSGAPALNVLFRSSIAMAEHGVTPTLVTGRYSCTGSTAYNNQTGQMGEVDIQVEFSAGS